MGSTELQRFIDNKSLVALKKFAKAEAKLKELKIKHDEVIAQVTQAMIDNNVTKLDGDWGSITLATKTTYSTTEDLKELLDEIFHLLATHKSTDTLTLEDKLRFVKLAVDTTKVKAQAVLTNALPEGFTESKTQYIVKKFKELK